MAEEKSMLDALDKREKKTEEKTVRTKANTKPKKAKKPTKKEQQLIDLEAQLVMPDNYHLINTPELFERFLEHYDTYKTMYQDNETYLDTETYGVNTFNDPIISISIGFNTEHDFNIPLRPFKHEESKDIPTLDIDYVMAHLRPRLEKDKKIVMANAKFDIHVLHNWTATSIDWNIWWDTVLAGGLLNENKNKGLKDWYINYALPDLVSRGIIKDERKTPVFKFGSLFNSIPFDEVHHRLATYYACHDTFMTRAVYRYQKAIFENPIFELEKVYKLFREIEMPLIPAFAAAERRGVGLDSEFLRDIIGDLLKDKLNELLNGSDDVDENGEKIVKGIYDYLGAQITLQKQKTRQKNGIKFKEPYTVVEDFNLGSPKQMVQKLYTEFGILEPVLEYDKKLKKKVPKCKTDKKTLTRNKKAHPVLPLILEYRGLSKLIQAFCDKLPNNAIEGIIHASYNQLVKTGRMSCSNPNLQQIPSKFDLIRYAFRAREGRMLASADFSQQELRWLAILTGDPDLIKVFVDGLDLHSTVTCNIHGLNYDMFEAIRNNRGESEAETKENMEQIRRDWGESTEAAFAMQYHDAKNPYAPLPHHSLDDKVIETLASFFELLRKKAKSVSFGTVYGITDVGLSDQIESSKEEAGQLIQGFKNGFPGYLEWEREVHGQILDLGYVETVLGRKRRFGEDLAKAMSEPSYKKHGWHWLIEKCKRQGGNSIIQGSSADQTKKAIIDLFYPTRPDGTRCLDREEWLENGYKSIMEKWDMFFILQVHDELVFDAPADTPPEAYEEITDTMANTITNDTGVNFKSDVEISPYWGGNFTQEQLQHIVAGKLDWRDVFKQEVETKLHKFGIDYVMGDFSAEEDEEAADKAVDAPEGGADGE